MGARIRHRPIRIGMVGAGFGQRVLAPVLQRNKNFALVGITAKRKQHAMEMAARLGIPKVYPNYKTMTMDPAIDAMVIATPPPEQFKIARAALMRHKPVFCEKPLAGNGAQAATLSRLAKAKALAHVVDYEFPEIPEWMKAKAILASGRLGAMDHVDVSWHVETHASRVNERSWKRNALQGGGVLNTFVSHCFYYLEWMLGPIQQISASLFPSPTCEEVAIIGLRWRPTTSALLSVNTNARIATGHRVSFYGKRGTLMLENLTRDYARGFRLFAGAPGGDRMRRLAVRPLGLPSLDGRIPAVARIAERFAQWIRTGKPTHPNIHDGARVDRLIDTARASQRKNSAWVAVKSA